MKHGSHNRVVQLDEHMTRLYNADIKMVKRKKEVQKDDRKEGGKHTRAPMHPKEH